MILEALFTISREGNDVSRNKKIYTVYMYIYTTVPSNGVDNWRHYLLLRGKALCREIKTNKTNKITTVPLNGVASGEV